MTDLETLKQQAAEQLAKYPQYAGYFEGSQKAVMLKTIKTKHGGIIAEKGEIVLVIAPEHMISPSNDYATIYSLKNATSGGFIELSSFKVQP
jgi:hypothetical protein